MQEEASCQIAVGSIKKFAPKKINKTYKFGEKKKIIKILELGIFLPFSVEYTWKTVKT
jgi:hypothetical protein